MTGISPGFIRQVIATEHKPDAVLDVMGGLRRFCATADSLPAWRRRNALDCHRTEFLRSDLSFQQQSNLPAARNNRSA
jgi:hypothetical protein